ncbi:MAG: hypothetical protein K2H61_06670 [Muribaculaceae bacterium]|nr:hypothetical protein [Muribaculaceae bacterium]
MKKIIVTSLIMAASLVASVAQERNSITTITRDGRQVTATMVTPFAVRITNAPVGEVIPDSKVIALDNLQTYKEFEATTSRVGNTQTLSSPVQPINVLLNNNSGAVSIEVGDANIIDTGMRGITPEGFRTMQLTTPAGLSYYGAGERGHKVNLAGDTLVMYNRQNYGYGAGDPRISQMNITMPMVITSGGFALIFDDYAAAELVLSDPITYTSEANYPITYYVAALFDDNQQTSLSQTVGATAFLTGFQPLPPLWTLGYITSKYGYKTADETLRTVERLQQAGYPLDGIVLDLYWYGQEQDMGRLAWDPEQWGDYKQMLKTLQDKNVNLVSISQPYVLRNGRGIDNYNFLAENGMLVPDSLGRPGEVKIWVGEGGMLDVSNPATRSWLAEQYKQMHLDGVDGFWGDLGEPEVHPDSLVHHNGLTTRQYHNLYGNEWSKIIADMLAENFPDERPMIMMRGGTIGLQRYGVFPWSTDVSRSWAGLQAQIPIMINSGLSGLGYMGHDVGGFAVDPENPFLPELYVRWLQLGLFSPMLRTHAQEYAEPFNYPELEKEILLPIIKERYRWLPYNVTLAFDNHVYGSSLVRPLNFRDNSLTAATDTIVDQFMWGEDVMVAPVLTPGTTERPVFFPGGNRWFDLNNPATIITGGNTEVVKAPLNVLPHYAADGSVIFMADYPMTSTADYRNDLFTARIFPTADGEAVGMLAIPQGSKPTADELTGFGLYLEVDNNGEKTLTVSGSPDTPETTFNIEIYDVNRKPSQVTAGNQKLKFSYSKKLRCLKFTVVCPASGDIKATIK